MRSASLTRFCVRCCGLRACFTETLEDANLERNNGDRIDWQDVKVDEFLTMIHDGIIPVICDQTFKYFAKVWVGGAYEIQNYI